MFNAKKQNSRSTWNWGQSIQSESVYECVCVSLCVCVLFVILAVCVWPIDGANNNKNGQVARRAQKYCSSLLGALLLCSSCLVWLVMRAASCEYSVNKYKYNNFWIVIKVMQNCQSNSNANCVPRKRKQCVAATLPACNILLQFQPSTLLHLVLCSYVKCA